MLIKHLFASFSGKIVFYFCKELFVECREKVNRVTAISMQLLLNYVHMYYYVSKLMSFTGETRPSTHFRSHVWRSKFVVWYIMC